MSSRDDNNVLDDVNVSSIKTANIALFRDDTDQLNSEKAIEK